MGIVEVTNVLVLSGDGTNYAGYVVTTWDWSHYVVGVAVGLAVGAVGYLTITVRRLFLGPGE